MTPEEFEAKFQAHMISKRADAKKEAKSAASIATQLNSIVLKFTTLTENTSDIPSFVVTTAGAKIGRDPSNEVSVPTDLRLAQIGHSVIEYNKGSFYLVDGGYDYSASVRIGVGGNRDQWALDTDARFSAGGSVFRCLGEDAAGNLIIEVLDGPVKGARRVIYKQEGATIGRSSDNTFSIPDRELSRRHSKIEFDKRSGRYVVLDIGSTNGTYIQLVGPYSGRYKLNLNDHILVGRTGFSVNRYDYGLSEEMGYRQTMEDACAIVQHLNIAPLNIASLSPQSFFGVYDGHGGAQASLYLSQNLHVNVASALLLAATPIREASAEDASREDMHPELNVGAAVSPSALDGIVSKCLREAFLKTDSDYLKKSVNPQHGSTATTALVLGDRLYSANVGDSRTLLCRNFAPYPLSEDHKPAREDEAKRIREAGGFIINNRVMGELAVSRAFGDSEFKKGIASMIEDGLDLQSRDHPNNTNWDQPLIVAEPEIKITTITPNDQFLLLACDGLFDVFTPEDAIRFVKQHLEEHRDPQKCCQSLTFEAIRKRNSRDNVSVILLILNKWY